MVNKVTFSWACYNLNMLIFEIMYYIFVLFYICWMIVVHMKYANKKKQVEHMDNGKASMLNWLILLTYGDHGKL